MSLNNLTVPELRKQAKLKGIVGYSKLRKAQLVSKLRTKTPKKKVKRSKIHIHLGGGNNPLMLPTPVRRPLPPPPLLVQKEAEIAKLIEQKYGKSIFDTFVKKYRVQNLFESRRKEIKAEMQQNKLTYENYKYLDENVISLYEEMFNNFVTRVNEKNEFVEKSGFGNEPRLIKEGKDWAEAIIELQGLINNFQNDFQHNFRTRVFSTPQILCKKMTLDKCLTSAECTIKKNVFGKPKECVPK
jgi:hypothetical protein